MSDPATWEEVARRKEFLRTEEETGPWCNEERALIALAEAERNRADAAEEYRERNWAECNRFSVENESLRGTLRKAVLVMGHAKEAFSALGPFEMPHRALVTMQLVHLRATIATIKEALGDE